MRLLASLLLLAACSDDATPIDASTADVSTTDAGRDAPADVGNDTTADATIDTSDDVAVDAPPEEGPIGWASQSGLGVATTTGGGDLAPTTVTTFEELQTAIEGNTPAVVRIEGNIEGVGRFGSNKTLEGAPGATFTGSLILSGVENIVIRNLRVVGYNCTDDACGDGRDAITVYQTHHVWIDHCDVSDGTDGNLDITEQSDFVTVSWTRFHYSGRRPGGHQLSNLVGASDTADDAGSLNVTWHHNWWGDNVQERMPRVRYGRNHLFNNLYTSSGNNYCIGLGVFGNVLLENNVFIGVDDPINSTSYSNAESVVESRGNIYTDTSGTTDDYGSGVFTPPYGYVLDAADSVESAVRAGAGVP